MGYGIFNMHADVNAIAHGGCTDTIKESSLKADWEKNPLLHCGIEPAWGGVGVGGGGSIFV